MTSDPPRTLQTPSSTAQGINNTIIHDAGWIYSLLCSAHLLLKKVLIGNYRSAFVTLVCLIVFNLILINKGQIQDNS